MLLNGAFTPLSGFMNQDEYDSVVEKMRLKSGRLWPIPITLDVDSDTASNWKVGEKVKLFQGPTQFLAVLTIESIWKPDKKKEALQVFGSEDDVCHPSVRHLHNKTGEYYVGGSLIGFTLPPHLDFVEHRSQPSTFCLSLNLLINLKQTLLLN